MKKFEAFTKRGKVRYNKKLKAFITIEMTLLIGVLVTIVTFLLFVSFYSYTKCIAKQNMYLVAKVGRSKETDEDRPKQNKYLDVYVNLLPKTEFLKVKESLEVKVFGPKIDFKIDSSIDYINPFSKIKGDETINLSQKYWIMEYIHKDFLFYRDKIK